MQHNPSTKSAMIPIRIRVQSSSGPSFLAASKPSVLFDTSVAVIAVVSVVISGVVVEVSPSEELGLELGEGLMDREGPGDRDWLGDRLGLGEWLWDGEGDGLVHKPALVIS